MDTNYSRKVKKEERNKKNHDDCNIIKSEKEINKEKIKLLINGLGDSNGLIRRSYAEELGKIGKAASSELIDALLKSKSVIQRRAAAKTLKLVEDPTTLPHLIKALTNDSDPVVQFSAAGAIAIFGESAVSHLIIVLENKEYSEMQHGLAAWCLSFIGAKAPYAIKKAAKSKNTKVKSAAISALEEHIRKSKDEEAIQLVKNAINDKDENIQVEAIKLVGKLYKIGYFIPILISKLKNKSPDIRKASILSLMQLNIKESKYNLKYILSIEKDDDMKKIIRLAIKTLDK